MTDYVWFYFAVCAINSIALILLYFISKYSKKYIKIFDSINFKVDENLKLINIISSKLEYNKNIKIINDKNINNV